jgi:repressor LexA
MFIPAPLLSPRQQQLCDTIERLTADRGFAPSLREVAEAMGVHPSRIQQLASTTERKGAITREPRVSRSWRVVKPVATAKAKPKRGR